MSKKHNHIRATWLGEHRFDAGRPGGVTHRIDAGTKEGPSPVDTLLNALATCTSVDVVDILAKRRTPVERLEMDVVGERVSTVPRRFRHVLMDFRVDGAGIERAHAERAVELAVTNYCPVRASLAPDVVIEWTVTLNGERGAVISEAAADYSV